MNRIYKVIWSKVKHQYVVVSELAHRDGKRSSAATTSRATWRALAVALMLTSSLAAVPYMGYALDGGTATQSQYIAVAMEPKDGAGYYEIHFKLGEGLVKEWVPDNSRKFGNYTYYLKTVTVNGEPKQYWVREGYDITVTQNQARYPSINQGTDYIIDAQKNEGYTEQSDQGLLQAYQTTTSAGDITTLTGVNIEDLNTGVYGGASNTAGVKTPSNWGYHIQVGGTGSDSEGYLKVSDDLDGTSSGRPDGAPGNTNFDTYFSHNVTLQNGVYVYIDREGKTVNVPTNKVYSIDGKLGVFTDANGNLYTGDVYGDNNEILLSGVGKGNQIYTYWGTKLTDPTQTIGNMTVEHYNKDRIELQQQSAAYHGDDIKDITVNQNENGGSFSFNRLGKYNKNTGKYEDADPAGVITIKNTATSGKSGDVAIEFSNGTDFFTVQAGSKVEGTTEEASGDTLTGLSINGVYYKLATKNNLIVAADADGDDNKGNWTITDTRGTPDTSDDAVFTNTTLDVAKSTFTPIGTSSDNVYGQNFTIADTAGNQFMIRDIASAKKLAEVDSLAVKYGTKDGEVDPTIIELMNPYTSEDHSGGTTITNVAYADINGDGGAAVNVDLLKDTVSAAKTEMAASDQHLIKNQETGSNGAYTVNDKNEVNLGVGTIDKDGNVTQTGTVTIKDVASASDLGDVTQIHDDLKNKDENGNSIDTSVVDAVNNLDDKVGDGDFSDTTYAKNETGDTSVTDAIHNLDNAINSATTIAGQHSSVSGSDNIDVIKSNGTNEYGGTNYEVTLKDDLTLGGKEGQGSISIKGSEGTINATGNIRAGSFSTGNITINKDNSGTINGLSNKTWDANNIVSGQAATEDQLKAATEAAVQYDRNGDGSVNKENISLGYKDEKGNQHLTQIHNVAAGSAPTDAVNFSQLSAVGDLAINNYNNIQVLNGSINKLDNRIDRVGAGAAALAALHPLDFDPDAKWDFAAGYGNYRGANAVAVGAYYRPNEDVMFSVGGSMGGGENMVNAGVSLKIGAGSSNVTTSRVAMAKEIKSMRDIVAKQDAQIQKLTAMVNALVGIQSEPDTTTMFPDVPENHWAYEAVEAMAKSGLVKGYPDGEFKGDRTMTRYEFAQIVYNAIQAGAEVDARLVEEFKPELEYFHIATVAKDKDGNPTIERVRAN